MPKAHLEFSLPEEAEDHRLALDAPRYRTVLWDFDQWLRGLAKHHAPDSPEIKEFSPPSVRIRLRELLRDNGISDLD